MDIASELAKRKRQIDDMKSLRDRTKGALAQLFERLEDVHKVKTVSEAEKLLEKQRKEQQQFATNIEKKTHELEEKYEW